MDISRQILSDIIIHNKYAKYLPELKRRETWDEIVNRNSAMHIRKYPQLKDEIESIYRDFVLPKRVLPSMRSLQFAGPAIEINNARMFNCSYLAIDDYRAFSEVCFLLLSGCGVGYSVQKHHVKKLPVIKQPIKTRKFLVEDSIMGWADAVKALCKSYFFGEKAPIFDFRDIRPKGSLLVTSGGKAPGPEPLRDMLHNIKKIFERKQVGDQLTSIECHDIVCYIAQAVLAGGVRRCCLGTDDVLTNKGTKYLKDINVGDLVKTPIGFQKVTGKINTGKQNVYKITTNCGDFYSTENHRWAVADSVNSIKWVYTKDLKPSDTFIFNSNVIEGEYKDFPKDKFSYTPPSLDKNTSWFIGYFLGNGSCSSRLRQDTGWEDNKIRVSCPTTLDIYKYVKKQFKLFIDNFSIHNKETSQEFTCSKKNITEYFLHYIKKPNTEIKIPEFIKENTIEIRAAFLAGLLDSDGCVRGETKDGKGFGQITLLSTKYYEFARQIQSLYASLGIPTKLQIKEREDKSTEYVVKTISFKYRSLCVKLLEPYSIKLKKDYVLEKPIKEMYGLSYHKSLKTEDTKYLWADNNYISIEKKDFGFIPVNILSIDTNFKIEETFDIEVENEHCFYINGILTHNSATISLFNMDDQDMLSCKHGAWWELNSQRALANNSAVLVRHKITKSDFMSVWDKTHESGSGEPGLFLTHDKQLCTNPCLTGDTKVALADGRIALTIKELADDGADVPVYCLNDRGSLAIRYMRAPRITGYNVPIYKITLDSGDTIRCTKNHKFLLKDGNYKETKDLKVNDSLSILTKYKASIKDIFKEANSNSQDYWWLTIGGGKVKADHRYIAEFYNNIELKTGMVVHHKDYNASNNDPNNLIIMTKEAHDKLHSEDMVGDKNPMRRAKYEWSEEKWVDYKNKQSVLNIGENNSNYSGYTNEDLKKHALLLTQKLGIRFSTNDWQNYAKTNKLPLNFSKWRKDHLGGITGLAKWAALELGVDNIDVDPRTTKYYKNLLSEGYNCFIDENKVKIKKQCEKCGGELITTNKEVSIHMECTRLPVHAKKLAKKSQAIKKQTTGDEQIQIYLKLKNPTYKTWREECKRKNVSYRIGEGSFFRNWDDLTEAASNYNHKIVSIELDGYEDVYNGTVDEYHNFFIGAFESKTNNGKDKLQFVNNLQCGEVSLHSMQFCNLTEINGSAIKTQEDLNNAAIAAAFIGTLQAGYTDFHYLRDDWKDITDKEALLGVGITGLANKDLLDLNFKQAADLVLKTNANIAKRININKAARTTLVKPSGTSSIVLGTSSGIHAWFALYYIRRIRLNKDEAIYKYLKKQLPDLVEDEFHKPDTVAVLSIPQKAPDGAIYRNESPIDLLERVKKIKQEWIMPGHRKGSNHHNVSVTVSIKDDEWDLVGNWMWENRDVYNGVSVLPYDGGTYKQAPFEEITESEYNRLFDLLKQIDLTKVKETQDETNLQGEAACAGGACEII